MKSFEAVSKVIKVTDIELAAELSRSIVEMDKLLKINTHFDSASAMRSCQLNGQETILKLIHYADWSEAIELKIPE